MGPIVVVLLLALVLAAAVMLYAAYPYRGEETPLSPARRQACAAAWTRCRPSPWSSRTARACVARSSTRR